MACSKPVLQGQSPVHCQFCEVDPKIQWKCEDCELLLCTKCNDNIHSKVKTAEEHRIINIKEVGKQSDPDTVQLVNKRPVSQDTVQLVNKGPASSELSIVQEYSTKFDVHYIQVALDDSLWIGSVDGKKNIFFHSRHLQKVKLERVNLKKISTFDVNVYDIAITPTYDLILADFTPTLKQILHNSNKVIGSYCYVEPEYHACSVHVTRNNEVVVGAYSKLEGAVYVMDMNGVRQKIYRHDNNNKPLFIYPCRITSTSTGTLCVIDIYKERLVMLGQGEVISVYTGHPSINIDKRFRPSGVVSTSNDNIIITDTDNNKLHILNITGSFLTYYDTRKIGIQNPVSIAFNTAGQFSILYIGCLTCEGKGKLYKLTLSVF